MGRIPPRLSPEPTLGERFGHNLWRARRRSGLSQEELASLTGLSRPHVSVLERGRSPGHGVDLERERRGFGHCHAHRHPPGRPRPQQRLHARPHFRSVP